MTFDSTNVVDAVLSAYEGLPPTGRTTLNVTAHVNESAGPVATDLVRDILHAKVLEHQVSPSEVQTAAKVLRALVDLGRTYPHSDSFEDGVSLVARDITRGLDRVDLQASREVYLCLAHIIQLRQAHRVHRAHFYPGGRSPEPRYEWADDIPF